jgi:transposase-like protein
MLTPREEGVGMPWQERTIMRQWQEFVAGVHHEGATMAAVCRHFGISRTTGYKWLARADLPPKIWSTQQVRIPVREVPPSLVQLKG